VSFFHLDHFLKRFGCCAEKILHNPIFKAVEGKDTNASPWSKHLNSTFYSLFDRIEFTVDTDSKSLEDKGCRVKLLLTATNRLR